MLENQPINTDSEVRPIVDAARNIWIRRLIDHSRANSLLFYRDLKIGTLDISDAGDALLRLLNGDVLRVDELVTIGLLPKGIDPADRIRVETETRKKTRNALIAIQRKALSNLEEKGIETLHLAIGLATWPAPDDGRPFNAPILLLPAHIEARGRSGEDLRLFVAGEPQLNPVLLYVLEENYTVRIDAAEVLGECGSEDDSGKWRIDPDCVFTIFKRITTAVPGFEVQQRKIIANFQFAKMAMVEDLKHNGDSMASSDIVAAIAGHSASRQQLAKSVCDIDAKQLDEHKANDEYLVLDADSTQQCAIAVIGKGQNCVIQGPPGTGKSQTIANLIAQSVGDGRRILFVAEKRAALDAVIKRLSHPDVNLQHLIIDLHGASVSRKEVMTRLASTLGMIRTSFPADGVETVHRDFEARRKQLNDHARRINQVRQPTGCSLNQIIGRILRLPLDAKSPVRLRGNILAKLTADHIDNVKQLILDGAANASLLLGTDLSPWNNAEIFDGRQAQDILDLVVKAENQLWPEFERRYGQIVHQLGIRPPETLDAISTLLSLLRDVQRIRQDYEAAIFSLNSEELALALAPVRKGPISKAWALISNRAYRSTRKLMLSLRVSAVRSSVLYEEALHIANVLQRWRALGSSSQMPVSVDGLSEFTIVFASLRDVVETLNAITKLGSLTEVSLMSLVVHLRALAGDQRTPYQMSVVHNLRSRLKAAGLDCLLDDYRKNNVLPDCWINRFEYIWYYSTLEEVLASDPGLASFNGRTHDQIVAEFKRLDRERIRLSASRVRRLHGLRAVEAMDKHPEQTDLVRRETAKKSRHIPLRQLLASAPDVLTRIAPCWVASPLSVSQLLDGSKRHFDLVVFDEASQILQEEAVPSLYRAGQVVVAGDRHQLPPTTFFATTIEDGDDTSGNNELANATAAVGGFESLLDTLEPFLVPKFLEWHYRSEDERLIAFSNNHIYSDRLVTFPSARGHDAIKHVMVPHDPSLGGQEESASREVEEVVRQVLDHVEKRPSESLGVITMGIKHANRVQAAIDRVLELRSDLADFFSLDREERFFVKNLETVQGDERDAIILSIGYGKNVSGDLPHRFGPLLQDTGYRRLNVAITRAKRRMCVISSFSHNEIDLERSSSRGVKLLKAYLEYAASGGRKLPEGEEAGMVGLNAFESDVKDALENKGIKTRPQFGASRYRIDLVAMHPLKQGRPVLAIECDGATYHSGVTARDRDRLRQTHLEKLGWRFHRIWSTDWFYGREQEMERAILAFEEAVRRADLIDVDTINLSNSDRRMVPRQSQHNTIARTRGPRPKIPSYETIDQYNDRMLREIAEWIVSDGLLRINDDLIHEMFALLPFKRFGPRIRARLRKVAQSIKQG